MVDVNKDNQKTIVAFIVGLLIGGLIVTAFSGGDKKVEKVTETKSEEVIKDEEGTGVSEEETTEAAPTLEVGEGKVVINDQAASSLIAIESVTYPVSEGWIGVRSYENEDLGMILGVVRFSESQGLIPENIILQTNTIAGRNYAVVFFSEDGDFDFNLAGDVQIDTIFDTFKAE